MSGSDDILARIDHALADPDVGEDAMRWTPHPPHAAPVPASSVRLRISVGAFCDALARFARSARAMARKDVPRHRTAHLMWIVRADTEREEARRWRHRARCRVCRPHSNPPPVAINGHEYHRRRRKRSKR